MNRKIGARSSRNFRFELTLDGWSRDEVQKQREKISKEVGRFA
jgi:hypothetical protein